MSVLTEGQMSEVLIALLDKRSEEIQALEAALAKADALADAAYRTIHDDADTSLVDALTDYRQARDATR